VPTLAHTPTPVATPTRAANTPAASPSPTANNGTASFGTVRDLNGLLAVVGNPDLAAGCNGTLDFELIVTNTTSSPSILGFLPSDIKLSGDGQSVLSLNGDLGPESPRCYGSFTATTLAPGTSATYALRTRDNLSRFKSLTVTLLGQRAGRLADQSWRLDLSTAGLVQRPPFGQTLISSDGTEVTTMQANYAPGCNGTFGFAITLRNTGTRAAALMLNSQSLHVYGDSKSELNVRSQVGAPTAECYGSLNLPSLNVGESRTLAARVLGNLASFTYLDIVFEGPTPLAGLRWRQQLPR
jgi:hypothetical protein